jgi:hypothetical protein
MDLAGTIARDSGLNIIVGKLLVASTFAAWAGAMWVVWREVRLTIASAPAPPSSKADLAIDVDLEPPPVIAPASPSRSVEWRERESRPRAPEAAANPEPVVETYDKTTTAEISGEVVDRDGQPMKSAVLTARCSGRVYEREVSASSFSLTVAPGTCTVFAADHLRRSQSRNFSVAAGDSVSITLAPRGLDDRPIE